MILAFIPILSSVLEFLGSNILNMAGGIGAVILLAVSWIAKKYLVPYLRVESRRNYAVYIAAIADEVTDELRVKYPDKKLIVYIDEAVDKVIDICGIDSEVARRAILASIARK